MTSFRNNPEGEENTQATRQNEREIFTLQQQQKWQCNLGNGEFDHDWEEKSDSSGEVDGGPGGHWSWRECRVCGEIESSK